MAAHLDRGNDRYGEDWVGVPVIGTPNFPGDKVGGVGGQKLNQIKLAYGKY